MKPATLFSVFSIQLKVNGIFRFSEQEPNQQQRGNQQQKSTKEKLLPFDSFPGRKALVERTPLIRHAGPRQTQEEIQRQQNAERTTSNSENQAFLKDVINQVLAGDGVGWLKLNRMRKLMEDESYRMFVLGKLNKTLDKKIGPDDHIDDVCVPKPVWRGILKCCQAIAHGLDTTFLNFGLGGMASVFQLMEIAHTHYWSKDLTEGDPMTASYLSSQTVSPMGSHENLGLSPVDSQPNSGDWMRKNSVMSGDAKSHSHNRRTSVQEASEHKQSTSDMFKDILSQKRNMILSKLTSFDSEVSFLLSLRNS